MPIHHQDEAYKSAGGLDDSGIDSALRNFQEDRHVRDCMIWDEKLKKPQLHRLVRVYDPQTKQQVMHKEKYEPRPFNRPAELGKSREFVPEDERSKFHYRSKKDEPGVADSMIWWPTTPHVTTRTYEKPVGRNRPGQWKYSDDDHHAAGSDGHHDQNGKDHHDHHSDQHKDHHGDQHKDHHDDKHADKHGDQHSDHHTQNGHDHGHGQDKHDDKAHGHHDNHQHGHGDGAHPHGGADHGKDDHHAADCAASNMEKKYYGRPPRAHDFDTPYPVFYVPRR